MNFMLIFFPVETRETLEEISPKSVYDSLVEECHCIICGYFIGLSLNLEEHFTDHVCLSDLSCRACPWKSSELETLVDHVRGQHQRFIVSQSCMICKISFSTKNESENHWKQHPLYKCDSCKFGTDYPESLVSHVEKRHSKC